MANLLSAQHAIGLARSSIEKLLVWRLTARSWWGSAGAEVMDGTVLAALVDQRVEYFSQAWAGFVMLKLQLSVWAVSLTLRLIDRFARFP